MSRRVAAVGLAVGVALSLAACGGSGSAGSGPAALAPADAPFYFEIVARPEGEAADGASAALGKVFDTDDPGQRIVSLLERSATDSGSSVDYEAEIEPWLGERVGFFPSSLAGESEVVLVVETTDPDAALEFVRDRENGAGRKNSYQGTQYELDADGDAFGIVDDYLVFGRPGGFQQAVDASKGDSLADADRFSDSVAGLPAERLATLYAIPKTFLEAIPDTEIDAQGRSFFLNAVGEAATEPVLGDLTASESALRFELSAGGPEGLETEQSSLVAALPADAWLGLGFADLGAAVGAAIESLGSAGIPGIDPARIRTELRAASGINVQREVIDALGDAALFVQGTRADSVGGALVVESKDPAASLRLLTKLQGLIKRQGDPREVRVRPLASAGGDQGFELIDPGGRLAQPVQVVQRGDRIVAGYGRASIEQALASEGGGAQTLAGSPAFIDAQQAVGELGVDAFLSLAPVFELAEAMGAANDPGYRAAKPYLDGLRFLAAGSGSEDGRTIARLVIGLRE